MTTKQAIEKFVKWANDQVGYKAKAGKNNKYAEWIDKQPDFYNGKKNFFDWCDIFYDVGICQNFGVEVGRKMLYQPKKSTGAGCGFSANFYRQNNAFTKTPQVGAQIFYGPSGNESHTGVVVEVAKNYIYTVEGNTGGGSGEVQKKKVPIGANISGYGIPNWSLVANENVGPYLAVDVSVFQGNINWSKVKNAGVVAAIIRLGGRYGSSGKMYTDSKGLTNIAEALKAGLKVGAYYYTQAITEAEAKEEAEFCIKQLKSYKKSITMPIYYDTEYLAGGRHNSVSVAKRTDLARVFCERIVKEGYKSGVYANIDWLKNNLNMDKLTKYETWVAQYYKECQYKGKYGIWQYTSTGNINGIAGNVDLNKGYIKYWEGDKPAPTPPTPTPQKGLDVDGILGRDSTKALQKWLGQAQDGIFSNQLEAQKKYIPNVKTCTFGRGGSPTVKSLQNVLKRAGYNIGRFGADGYWGYDTVRALQQYLNAKINAKLTLDGILGSNTAKALQKYLNKVVYGV